MNSKKIVSFVMAIAMAMSLLTTAMASGTGSGGQLSACSGDSLTHEARYTGTTSVPVIDLAVTGINSVLAFNPYKLGVSVNSGGEPVTSGGSIMNDQFITKEITITNRTNVPLKMEGKMTVTASLDSATAPADARAAELTNRAITATETAKKLYVYADFYAYDGAYAEVPDRTKTAASAQRLVAATSGTAVSHTTANRVTLQADDNGTADGGQNYVYVKVNGEATPSPTTAWGAYDKVDVSFTFTFQSEPNYAKYAVVEKSDSTNVTVYPVYSKYDVKVDKGSDNSDLCKGVAQKAVAGSVCYITPSSGNKITAVKFYDKAGAVAITTVRAASTDTKTPTAPWSFTMPADNVVMEVTTAAA